jgi:hypothetical protein
MGSSLKRSGGITASAVIAIIGSVFTILMGALIVMASIMARSTLAPNPTSGVSPEASAMTLAIVAVTYVGLGIWGIVSAIGVLRLRNWARICFVVFGGILAAFSLLVALGVLLIFRGAPQIQSAGAGASPEVLEVFIGVFVVIALLFTALGIWWVVYFSRDRVRVLFLGEEPAPAHSRLPLSISIVAWILIVGGLVFLPRILAPSPLLVFSFIIHGSAARMIYFLMAAISLVSGIGMLKKVEQAHSLALIYFVYSLVNTVASLLIPGSSERRQQFIQEIQGRSTAILPLNSMNSIATFSIVIGLGFLGVGIWFLVTRRQAFLESVRG